MMHRVKPCKIKILYWLLFVTQFTDALEPILNNGWYQHLVDSNTTATPVVTTSTPSNVLTSKPTENINGTTEPCNPSFTLTPNVTVTITIKVNSTDDTTKILDVIDSKLNLTKPESVAGLTDLNRVKKDIPITMDPTASLPKLLRKKETGHGKIFLLSSIISNGNVLTGNVDSNNYEHKRNSKDEVNHNWKFRKPIKFQKVTKPSMSAAASNNQDSNKIFHEMYNKNSAQGGEVHDNKKLSPVMSARFEPLNSNLLIDYLFPSMFKNIFSHLNREYLPPSQNAPFNEISYTDKLSDGWFNLKDESAPSLKCTCGHLRKPNEIDNTKMDYSKDKFGLVHIPLHAEIEKFDSQYGNINEKEPSDNSLILSL